jgi:hypothetical protein
MKRHNMKKNIIINICTGLLSVLSLGLATDRVKAQEAAKSPLVVAISYYTLDNKVPYLLVNAKSKVDGKFQPVKGAEIKLYLDKDSTGQGLGLIGKLVTNEKGKAGTNIPPSLEKIWKASVNHTFIAVTDKTKKYDETNTELSIAKARITVDTADDKNVVATFAEFKGSDWVPVKGVEVKIGIKRLGGDLQIGEEQTYTTDSLGHVKGEFKKIGMPGDEAGNIILVAKVEDNDQFGNLRIEKSIPWGKKFVSNKDFFHRALWGSQFHSPIWLVVMAYSIIIAVWGTLLYLIFLILKIKKLGRAEEKLN